MMIQLIFLTTLLGGVATQETSGDSPPEPPNSFMVPEEGGAVKNNRYTSGPQVQKGEPMALSNSEVRQTESVNSQPLPIETIRFTSNPGDVARHSSELESLNGGEKLHNIHPHIRFSSQSAASAAEIAPSRTLQPSLISNHQQDAQRTIDPHSSYTYPSGQGMYPSSLSEPNSSPFQSLQPVNGASNTDAQNLQSKLAFRNEHAGYSEEISKLQPGPHPEAPQESLNSDSSNLSSFSIFSTSPPLIGGSTVNGIKFMENKPAGILSPQFINNVTDPVNNINGSLLTMDTTSKTDEQQLDDSPDNDKRKSLKPYPTTSFNGERTINLLVPDPITTQRTTDTSNPIPPISLNDYNSTLPSIGPFALNTSFELSPNISSSENNPQTQEGTMLQKLMGGSRQSGNEFSISPTPNADVGNPRSLNPFRSILDPEQQFIPFPLNSFPLRPTVDTLPDPIDGFKTLTPILSGRAFTPNSYPDVQNSPSSNKMDLQPDSQVTITPDIADSRFPGLKLIGESFSTVPIQYEGTIGFWSSIIPILFGGRPMPIFSTNGSVQASEQSLQNPLLNPPGFFITSRNINFLGSLFFPTETHGQSKDIIDQLKPITGQEPQTVNIPAISGQEAIQIPAIQNTFNPATPTISGSMFPFFLPQNPTNNITSSDRLYLFPISIQLNLPINSGFGGKIKLPTLETSSKLPFSLIFRPISPYGQAKIKQDPGQGLRPSPLATIPFEPTESLDSTNYLNLYYNPSNSVTPGTYSSGNLTVPRPFNVAERAMIGFPPKPFDPTVSPQIANDNNLYYGYPYYGNPYEWNPNMVNLRNPSNSGTQDRPPLLNSAFPASQNFPTRPINRFPTTPLDASRTIYITERDNPDYLSGFRTNGKYIPLDTATIPDFVNFKELPITEATNYGKPNYINPYYNHPNYGYPEYAKQGGKTISGTPDTFQPHNPTMTEPRITPRRPIIEPPTTPFDSPGIPVLTNYGDPHYLNTNPKHVDQSDRNPYNNNPEYPSDSITPINIPSSKQTIPSSRSFPIRPIIASPSAPLNVSEIPGINYGKPNYGNPNYLNLNYRNPNYDNPDYSFDSGAPDRNFPLRRLVIPGSPNVAKWPQTVSPTTSFGAVNPDENPNYINPEYLFNSITREPLRNTITPGSRNIPKKPITESTAISLDPSGIPVSTERGGPIYTNPNFGNPNYGNPNDINPIYGNLNYDSPAYSSDSGTPGSFSLRNSPQGSRNIPKRPLTGSPIMPLDNKGIPDNTDHGNSNIGNPNNGIPGDGYPYNGNPQYATDFRIPGNVILNKLTIPSSQSFLKTPITGTPTIPFDTPRIPDSENSNPNYRNPNKGKPNNGDPNYDPNNENLDFYNPKNPNDPGTSERSPLSSRIIPGSRNIPKKSITGSPTMPFDSERIDEVNYENPNYLDLNNRNPDDANPKYDNPEYTPESKNFPFNKFKNPGTQNSTKRPIIGYKVPYGVADLPDNTDYGIPYHLYPNNRNPIYGNQDYSNGNPEQSNPEYPSDSESPGSIPLRNLIIPGSYNIPKKPGSPEMLFNAYQHADIPDDKDYGIPYHPSSRNIIYGKADDGNPNIEKSRYPAFSGTSDGFPIRNPTIPGKRNMPQRPITSSSTTPFNSAGIPDITNYGDPKYPITKNGNQGYGNPDDRNPYNGNPNYPTDSRTSQNFPYSKTTTPGSHDLSNMPTPSSPATPFDTSEIPINTDHSNPNYLNPYKRNPEQGYPNNINPNPGNPNYDDPEYPTYSRTTDSFPLRPLNMQGPHNIAERLVTGSRPGIQEIPNSSPNYLNSYARNPDYGKPGDRSPYKGNPDFPSGYRTPEDFPLSKHSTPDSRDSPKRPIGAASTAPLDNSGIPSTAIQMDNKPNILLPNNVNRIYGDPKYINSGDRNPNYEKPEYPTSSEIPGTPLRNIAMQGSRNIPKRPITATSTVPLDATLRPDNIDHDNPDYINPNNVNPNHLNPNYVSKNDGNPKYPSYFETLYPRFNNIIPSSHTLPENSITGSPSTPLNASGIPVDIDRESPNYLNLNRGNPNYGNPHYSNPNYLNPIDRNPNYSHPEYPTDSGTQGSFPHHSPYILEGQIIPTPTRTPVNTDHGNPNYSNPNNANPTYRDPNYINPSYENPKLDNPKYTTNFETPGPRRDNTMPGSHNLPEKPITWSPSMLDVSGMPDTKDHGSPKYFNPNKGNPNYGNPYDINPVDGSRNYDRPEDPSDSSSPGTFPPRNIDMQVSRYMPKRPITETPTMKVNATRVPDNRDYGNPDYPNQNEVNPNYSNPNYLNPRDGNPNFGNQEYPSYFETIVPERNNNNIMPGSLNFPEKTITGSPSTPFVVSRILDLTDHRTPNYLNYPKYLNLNRINPNYGNPDYVNPIDRNPNYDNPEYPTESGTPGTYPLHNVDTQGSRYIPKSPTTATPTKSLSTLRVPDNRDYGNPDYPNRNEVNPNYRNPNYLNPKDGYPNFDNQKYPSYFETPDPGRHNILPGSENLPEKPITGSPSTPFDVSRMPDKTDHGSPNYLNLNRGKLNYGNPNYINPIERNPNYDHPEYSTESGTPGTFPLRDIDMQGSRYIPKRPITETPTMPVHATRVPDNTDFGNPNYPYQNRGNPNDRNPNYSNPKVGNPNFDNQKYPSYLETIVPGRNIMPGSHNLPEKTIPGSASTPFVVSRIPDLTDHRSPNYLDLNRINPNYGNQNDINPIDRNPNYDHPEDPNDSSSPSTFPPRNIDMQVSLYIPKRPITETPTMPVNATRVPDNRDYGNPDYPNRNEVNPNYRNPNYLNPKDGNPNFGNQEYPSYFETIVPERNNNNIMPGSLNFPEKTITGSPSTPFDVSRIPVLTDNRSPNYLNDPNYLNLNRINPNYGNPNYVNPIDRNPNYDNPEYPTVSGTPGTYPLHNVDTQGSRYIPKSPTTATPTKPLSTLRAPGNTDYGNQYYPYQNIVNPNYRNPSYLNPKDGNPNFGNQEYPSYLETIAPQRNNIMPGSHNLPEKTITGSPSTPFDISRIPDVKDHRSPNYLNYPNYLNLNRRNPNSGNPNYVNPIDRNSNYDHPEYPTESGTPGAYQLHNVDMQGFPYIPKSPLSATPVKSLNATRAPDSTDYGSPNYPYQNVVNPNYRNPTYLNPIDGNPNFDNQKHPFYLETLDPGRNNPLTGSPSVPYDVSRIPEFPTESETPDAYPLHNIDMPGSRYIPRRPITATRTMPFDATQVPDNTDHENPNYSNLNKVNPYYMKPVDRNPSYNLPEYPKESGTPGSFPLRNIAIQGSSSIPEIPIKATPTTPLDATRIPGNTVHGNENPNPNQVNPNYSNPNYINPNDANPNFDNPKYPSHFNTFNLGPSTITPGSHDVTKKPVTGSSTMPSSTSGIPNNKDNSSPSYLNPNNGNPNYGKPNFINPIDGNPNYYSEYPSDSRGSRNTPEMPKSGSSTMPLGASKIPGNTDHGNPYYMKPNDGKPFYINTIYENPNNGNPEFPSRSELDPRRKYIMPGSYDLPNKPKTVSPTKPLGTSVIPENFSPIYLNPNNGISNYKPNYIYPIYENPNLVSAEYPSNSGKLDPQRNIIRPGSHDLTKQPMTLSPTLPLDPSIVPVNIDRGNPIYLNPNNGNINYGNPIYINPKDINSYYDYPEYLSDSGALGSIQFSNLLLQGSRNIPKRPVTGSSTMELVSSTTPDTTDRDKPHYLIPDDDSSKYDNSYFINPNDRSPDLGNTKYPSNSEVLDPQPNTIMPGSHDKPKRPITGSPSVPLDPSRIPFSTDPDSPVYISPKNGLHNLNYINPNDGSLNYNYPSDSGTSDSFPPRKVLSQGSRDIPKQPITGSLSMPLGSSATPDNTDRGKPHFLEPNDGNSKDDNPNYINPNEGNPKLNNRDYPSNSGILDPRRSFMIPGLLKSSISPTTELGTEPLDASKIPYTIYYSNPKYLNSDNGKPYYVNPDYEGLYNGSPKYYNSEYPAGSRTPENFPERPITGSVIKPFNDTATQDITNYSNPDYLNPSSGNPKYEKPNNKTPNYKDSKYPSPEYPSNFGTPISSVQPGPVISGSRTTGTLDITGPPDLKNKYYENANHGYPNSSPVNPSASGAPDNFLLSRASVPGSPDFPNNPIMGSSTEPTNVTDNMNYGNVTSGYPRSPDALKIPNNIELKNFTFPGFRNFPVRPIMASLTAKLLDAPEIPDTSNMDGNPNNAFPEILSHSGSPISRSKYPWMTEIPQQTAIGSSTDPLDATRIREFLVPKYKYQNNIIAFDGNTQSPDDNIPLGKSTFPVRKYLERPIIKPQTEPFDSTGTSIVTNYENPASPSDGDSTDYVRSPSSPLSYKYTPNLSRERPALSVRPLTEKEDDRPDIHYIRKWYPLNSKYGTQPDLIGNYDQNPSHLNILPTDQPLSGSRIVYGGNPSVYPETRFRLGYPNQYYYYKLPSSPATEVPQESNTIAKPNDYEQFLKKLPPGTGQWYVTIPSGGVNVGSPDPTSSSPIQSGARGVQTGHLSDTLTLGSKESSPSDRTSATTIPDVTIELNLMSSVVPTVSTTSSSPSGQMELIKPNIAGTESNLYFPTQRFSEPSHLDGESLPIENITGKPKTAEQRAPKVFVYKDAEEPIADSPKSSNPAGHPVIGSTTITVIPHYSKVEVDPETLLRLRQSDKYPTGQDPLNKESGRSIRYYPAYTRSGQLVLQQPTPDKYRSPTYAGEQPGSQNMTELDRSPNVPNRSSDLLSNPSNPTSHISPQPNFEESTRYELTNYPTRPSGKLTDSSVPSSRLPSEPSSKEKIYANSPDMPTPMQKRTGERSDMPGSIRHYPANTLSVQTSGEQSTSDGAVPINGDKISATYISKQYALPNYFRLPSIPSTDSTDPSEPNPDQIYASPQDGVATKYYNTGQRVIMPGPIRYYSMNTVTGPTSGDLSAPREYDLGAQNNDRTQNVPYITKMLTLPIYPSRPSNQLAGSSDPSFESSSKEPSDTDSPANSAVKHYRIIQRLNTTVSSRYYQPNYTLPDRISGEQSASDPDYGGQRYIIKKQLGATDSTVDTTKASGINMEKLPQGSTNDVGVDSDSLTTIIRTAKLIGSPQTQSSRVSGYRIMPSPIFGSVTDRTGGSLQYSSSIPIDSNAGKPISYYSTIAGPSNTVVNQPSVHMNPVVQSPIVNGARYIITNPGPPSFTQYNTGPVVSSSGTSTVVNPLQYITRPITTQVKYSVIPASYRRLSGTPNGQFVNSQTLPDMRQLILANLPKGIKSGTRGSYSYTFSDGRTVITKWYVDDTGFHIEGEQNAKARHEDLRTS